MSKAASSLCSKPHGLGRCSLLSSCRARGGTGKRQVEWMYPPQHCVFAAAVLALGSAHSQTCAGTHLNSLVQFFFFFFPFSKKVTSKILIRIEDFILLFYTFFPFPI